MKKALLIGGLLYASGAHSSERWLCEDSTGHRYQVSQNVRSDTCRRLGAHEVLEFSDTKPAPASVAPAVLTVSQPVKQVVVPQEPDSLITRCEKLRRQSDRNTCIAEVIRSASTQPKARSTPMPASAPAPSQREIVLARAHGVLAAADSVQSVVNVGISYNDYSPYLQRLAIALDQYKAETSTAEELRAVGHLTDALIALTDAREFWRADIDFYSRSDNRVAYAGGLPVALAGVTSIVEKYRLPLQNSDWLGFHQGVPRGEALRQIWQYFAYRVGDARRALDEIGKAPVTTQSPSVASLPDNIRRLAGEVMRGEGCEPVGELQTGLKLDGRDVLTSDCSGGRQQSVSCSVSECVTYEPPPYYELSWDNLK